MYISLSVDSSRRTILVLVQLLPPEQMVSFRDVGQQFRCHGEGGKKWTGQLHLTSPPASSNCAGGLQVELNNFGVREQLAPVQASANSKEVAHILCLVETDEVTAKLSLPDLCRAGHILESLEGGSQNSQNRWSTRTPAGCSPKQVLQLRAKVLPDLSLAAQLPM